MDGYPDSREISDLGVLCMFVRNLSAIFVESGREFLKDEEVENPTIAIFEEPGRPDEWSLFSCGRFTNMKPTPDAIPDIPARGITYDAP